MKFIVQYQPKRADFLETVTDAERSLVAAHFEYLEKLLAKRILLFAGRRVDAAFGIAVMEAESLPAAERLLAGDPAVSGGVFSATLGEFRFALSQDPSLL